MCHTCPSARELQAEFESKNRTHESELCVPDDYMLYLDA